MSCTKTHTFFRICGHIYLSTTHNPPCTTALSLLHPAVRDLPENHWNTLPFITKYSYIVGKCPHCSPQPYPPLLPPLHANPNPLPPPNPGTIQNLDPEHGMQHSTIVSLALYFRHEVEAQERLTRSQEIDAEARRAMMRRQRRAQWEGMFETYASDPANIARDGMPHIFDLSVSPHDHFDEGNGCLVRADPDQEHVCDAEGCGLVIHEEDEMGIAVRCPCGHVFHLAEVIDHYGSLHRNESKDCLAPHCGAGPYNLVIRNGFEEPVRRWFEEWNRWCWVDGYIEFRPHSVFRSQLDHEFLPFEGEDRWVDDYNEDHLVYQLARPREEAVNLDEHEEPPPPYQQRDFQHERPLQEEPVAAVVDGEVEGEGVENIANPLDEDELFF